MSISKAEEDKTPMKNVHAIICPARMRLIAHRVNIRKPFIGIGVIVIVASLFGASSWASDLLQLSSLHASPDVYRSKSVRIVGRVTRHHVTILEYDKCTHSFTVQDATGTMKAVYTTVCPAGGSFLRNGDRVTIDGHFESTPGTAGLLKVHSILSRLEP